MEKRRLFKELSRPMILLIFGSAVLSLLLQWITAVGEFGRGFVAAFLLIFLSSLVLYGAWRLGGKGKALGWMILLAFILRLALAVFWAWGLPQFGYPEPTQQAGFVFEDAFRRETSAWELAQSDQPLKQAFSSAFSADQYGGMLGMSAWVYRNLSPDAFRPILIAILSAGAMALSLPLLVETLKHWFNLRAVLAAGWILAFYPEGLLLGAAQMREPFLILFIAMNLWAVSQLLGRKNLLWGIIALLFSVVGLFTFSYRVALPVMGSIVLWIWVTQLAVIKKTWIKAVGWAAVVLLSLGIVLFFREWISEVFRWDALLTFRHSGMVQAQLERLPQWLRFPFILVYGLFQPVLPAAIVAPGKAVWVSLGIIRAVGWYLLLPLLFYGVLRVWKEENPLKRNWLVVFALMVWAWVIIASARAGGDQWDNPRYRTIFLPWMAAIAGWTIYYAREYQDRWLKRIFMIEGVFLFFFTFWYVDRYLLPNFSVDMLLIILLIFVFSLLILLGGSFRDRRDKKLSLTE